jgi:hypothetical protein
VMNDTFSVENWINIVFAAILHPHFLSFHFFSGLNQVAILFNFFCRFQLFQRIQQTMQSVDGVDPGLRNIKKKRTHFSIFQIFYKYFTYCLFIYRYSFF